MKDQKFSPNRTNPNEKVHVENQSTRPRIQNTISPAFLPITTLFTTSGQPRKFNGTQLVTLHVNPISPLPTISAPTRTLPNIGAAVRSPLSLEDIWKSHVADGRTNDIIVIPTAVFKYKHPHSVSRRK